MLICSAMIAKSEELIRYENTETQIYVFFLILKKVKEKIDLREHLFEYASR